MIELLVVIAIIAILAAILFPVFAQAKTAAKKTSSLSQMKQIGLAATLYNADFDDWTFPRFTQYSTNGFRRPDRGITYWANLLQPYTKTYDVFICPADRADDPAVADTQGRGRFDRNNEFRLYVLGSNPSYGFNSVYLNQRIPGMDPGLIGQPPPVGGPPPTSYLIGISLSQVEAPSDTVMFGEATMKNLPSPLGGTVQTTIGFDLIRPPFGDPPSFTTAWRNFTFPNARSQGQLWGRFKTDSAIIVQADGSAKVKPIKSLIGQGTTREEVDRFWNGLGR